MPSNSQQVENDAFLHEMSDTPFESELRKMSFIELASILASSASGTTRYIFVEREISRRKSKDQLWAAVIGALIGGAFTLAAAFITFPSAVQQQSTKCEAAVSSVSSNDLKTKQATPSSPHKPNKPQ